MVASLLWWDGRWVQPQKVAWTGDDACCLILFFVATACCLLGKDFQDWPLQATDWGGECDRCEYIYIYKSRKIALKSPDSYQSKSF